MVNALTAVAFLLIASFVFVVAQMVFRLRRDPVRERLASLTKDPTLRNGRSPVGEVVMSGLAGQLPILNVDAGELDKDLRRAGFYRPSARQEYLAIRNGLVLFVAISAGVLAVVIGPERQDVVIQVLVVGLVLAGLCFAVPRILLKVKGQQRMRRIGRGLPDVLDMINMCLTGGLGIQDVLGHVSREVFPVHPDFAVELVIIRQQAEMNSVDFAFQQFAERVDIPEVVGLSALIRQNQKLGTSVANSIRDYADNIRLNWRQAAVERAGRTQWAVLFPAMLLLVPSVAILLCGPSFLELLDFIQNFDQFATSPGT
jgi:tight adherence protein C